MAATTIRIREKDFRDDTFALTVTFRGPDGAEKETNVQLPNPNDPATEQLLEWYYEDYIGAPYDDVRAAPAVDRIRKYGTDLFGRLFAGDANLWYHAALGKHGPGNFAFEITGSSPAFQSIYWESLWDPRRGHPFAEEGITFLRKQVYGRPVGAEVEASPTLNLLIVTARPGEEDDVNYRTIQRPLIDLIQNGQLRVRPHILRPGTYEALVQHLGDKAGHYHVVHFDLHGGLLDYPTYRDLREKAGKVTFRNVAYRGSYALPELPEADFNGGTRAFLFFESEEKGTAVPVEAGQLAAQLESTQIPICILNACQSAKQDGSAHETSLGRALIARGIQVVLAMRYSVSVSAAEVLMKTLYKQLYAGEPIERAIAQGRRELYRNKDRRAAYNHRIDLEDWLLPVVYQNGRPQLHLREPTPQEREQMAQHGAVPLEARQTLEYGFFGRDLDILKIEKNLLVRSNLLLLQGMGGAGKTTLLKYLADWWLRTGFVEKVFYFGYDVKAYSLNEILFHIARHLYDRFKFATFTALLPEVQADEMVRELRAKRYALILDNTESITGEKLSIPNTLPPAERTALKSFLTQLKGGQSIVLIGSRSDEEWLKLGTFGNNRYLLQGLDHESATNFAHEILKENGLEVKTVAAGPHFERLMKLLAGYPLALKAILPNLKRKTAKVILDELQAGVGDLDKGNPQEKTQSIIKCIEYAHSNLSEDAQKLLLCLSPFQSVVNVTPSIIQNYFDELKKEEPFEDYPFHKFEEVVGEAVKNGFMQEESSNSPFQIMAIQPVFTYFLKNTVQAANLDLKRKLENVFIEHYYVLSDISNDLISSKEPLRQKVGEWLIEQEYENFCMILNLLLARQERVWHVIRVVVGYLEKQNRHTERLQVVEMVHLKMQHYDPHVLDGETCFDYVEIKNALALTYYSLNQYNNARSTWEDLVLFTNTHPFLTTQAYFQQNKAAIYQNLGGLAHAQQDFNGARDYFQKALEIFVHNKDVYNQGLTYQNLGAVTYMLLELKVAKDYNFRALDIYKQHQDVYSQGQVYQQLGAIAQSEKNYNEAKDYSQQALAIFIAYGDFHSQGRMYQNLGVIAYEQQDYEAAKDYLQKALAIFVHYQDIHRQGMVYHNLGALASAQQDYEVATSYLQKALDIFKLLDDDHRQGQIYQNLGVIAHEQQNYEVAKDCLQKALPIFVKNQNIHQQGQIYQNLGGIAHEQQDHEAVKDYYQKALAIYEQYEDVYSQGQIYYNLGLFAKEQQDFAAAREYFQKALKRSLLFPEDTSSNSSIILAILKLAKQSNDKVFGKAMYEKALPHIPEEHKAELQALYNDLDKP